ncbi:MAG: PIN domain-containing protein [Terracidiphilus sp.]|nr:PIN domain-containing protein [Terracidiphilus sp.]
MSRICWDSMLFIYLLEDHPVFSARVRQLLERARRRGDSLFATYLTLGEMLAGASKSPNQGKTQAVREVLGEIGFSYLPFDAGAVETFSRLRGQTKLAIADSIHLACAASAGIDLFLTGDRQLARLDVPGIQFIADFTTPVL